MNPIVLATDGSPSAAEATLQAVKLAQMLDAPLIAVAVEHVSVPSYGYFGYAQIVSEMSQMERNHVERTLAQTKAIAADAGVDSEIVHGTGVVHDEICAVARRRKAQMIVIGAHGWGPLRRALQGSVSTAVVHQAACPVLVVRGGPEVQLESAAPMEEAIVS